MKRTLSNSLTAGSMLLTGEPLGPTRTKEADHVPDTSRSKPRRRGGPSKGPMKQLTDAEVKRALLFASTHYDPPEAAVLKLALSIGAGARASEISKLRMTHVTDGDGNIADVINFTKKVAKKGRARPVPMDPLIRHALLAYRKRFPGIDHLATARRSGQWQKPGAVRAWFFAFYHKLGLEGCGSHSGRKTFITNLAKAASSEGMTLRDVQELAGHARLSTTQVYIALSPNHDKLVAKVSPARLFPGMPGER